MNSQTKRVGDYLLRHGKITPLEALQKLGTARLAARIWDLKREGFSITRRMKWVRTRNGETRVAEYRL